ANVHPNQKPRTLGTVFDRPRLPQLHPEGEHPCRTSPSVKKTLATSISTTRTTAPESPSSSSTAGPSAEPHGRSKFPLSSAQATASSPTTAEASAGPASQTSATTTTHLRPI